MLQEQIQNPPISSEQINVLQVEFSLILVKHQKSVFLLA